MGRERDGGPLRIVCARCGSPEISRDAWAMWDEGVQDWVLREASDYLHCHRCGTQTSEKHLPLEG